MQKENSSFFLPAIAGIIFLLLIGTGLMYLSQKKSQINNPSNLITNNSSQITTTVTPLPKTPEGKMAAEILLTISEPVDKSTVTFPNLIIRGKTVANAEVSINDQTLPANANGDFSAQVSLEEGDNYFYITAIDANGNSSEKEIMITYESQTP